MAVEGIPPIKPVLISERLDGRHSFVEWERLALGRFDKLDPYPAEYATQPLTTQHARAHRPTCIHMQALVQSCPRIQ